MAPEQTGPTMPVTTSTFTSLVTASTAATGSQALSTLTAIYFWPSENSPPWSFTCSTAKSTAADIGFTSSGIGPVRAIGFPIFTSE